MSLEGTRFPDRNCVPDRTSALSRFVPCQALFFVVGKNDSRLVGRLLSVSQPEFYELTQHEEQAGHLA